jgi:hypothetical protein
VELRNGSLLAAGGYDGGNYNLDTAEVYDPHGREWVGIERMRIKRPGCRAALLKNGSVIVAGAGTSGPGAEQAARSAELFGTAMFRCFVAPGSAAAEPSCQLSKDGTGSDFFSCAAVCGAPSPSYRCADNQCVQIPGRAGETLAQCESICGKHMPYL